MDERHAPHALRTRAPIPAPSWRTTPACPPGTYRPAPDHTCLPTTHLWGMPGFLSRDHAFPARPLLSEHGRQAFVRVHCQRVDHVYCLYYAGRQHVLVAFCLPVDHAGSRTWYSRANLLTCWLNNTIHLPRWPFSYGPAEEPTTPPHAYPPTIQYQDVRCAFQDLLYFHRTPWRRVLRVRAFNIRGSRPFPYTRCSSHYEWRNSPPHFALATRVSGRRMGAARYRPHSSQFLLTCLDTL